MKTLLLTQGKTAVVDNKDYARISGRRWHVTKKGRRFYARAYVRASEGGPSFVYLHHEIAGRIRIDHKNGDGLDNRRRNLRPANHSRNARGFQRKAEGTTSQFRGVYWDSGASRWRAYIWSGGKTRYIGLFHSEKEAARAYDSAALKFGFSREALNFRRAS